MSTKLWIGAMTAMSVLYLGLMLQRGIVLIIDPSWMVKALGLALLLLPLFAFWAIAKEIGFGLASERLARKIPESSFDDLGLEYRPSGRATKESAEVAFERIQKSLARDETWQNWFLAGVTYEANSDRKRARAAIRKAIELERLEDA
jgi:hypothetical protein